MKLATHLFLLFIGLYESTQPANAKSLDLYLSGKSKIGFVLCHGGGAYPDWKVVGHLRKSLNASELEAHTNSLQMPTATGIWTNYLKTFPDATRRIHEGITFLKKRGVDTIILIGHSMGSRMATYFLASEKNHGVKLFVGLGMRNNGGEGLNVISNILKINIPVLDIYGSGGNGRDFKYGQERNAASIHHREQIVIRGANHKFDGYGAELNKAIVGWVKSNLDLNTKSNVRAIQRVGKK